LFFFLTSIRSNLISPATWHAFASFRPRFVPADKSPLRPRSFSFSAGIYRSRLRSFITRLASFFPHLRAEVKTEKTVSSFNCRRRERYCICWRWRRGNAIKFYSSLLQFSASNDSSDAFCRRERKKNRLWRSGKSGRWILTPVFSLSRDDFQTFVYLSLHVRSNILLAGVKNAFSNLLLTDLPGRSFYVMGKRTQEQ